MTESGQRLPCCTRDQWCSQWDRLLAEEMSEPQIVEGVGYSFAMVVRAALAHSAFGGRVTAFITDSIPGSVVCSALRHLVNGGCEGRIVVIAEKDTQLQRVKRRISGLLARNCQAIHWSDPSDWQRCEEFVNASHNVLCGISDLSEAAASPHERVLIQMLNESSTPVHCVALPVGVAPVTTYQSLNQEEKLFASSTLSLGLPLHALLTHEEYIGRHYIADLSWSRESYSALGLQGLPLFLEQPVIKVKFVENTERVVSEEVESTSDQRL